jgi:hypothetical protein
MPLDKLNRIWEEPEIWTKERYRILNIVLFGISEKLDEQLYGIRQQVYRVVRGQVGWTIADKVNEYEN